MKRMPMMKLRALIVDDMPLSRARTRRYLAAEQEIEIVGECGDAETALVEIDRYKPNVLFLDVQMPGITGLGLLERIPTQGRPAIIFITAFGEFAVSAFAAQAVDYLLKPFDRDRLIQALAKVRVYLKHQKASYSAVPLGPSNGERSYLERIPVKSIGRTIFVTVASIDWIETAGNYLILHVGKDTHLVRETMGQIETQLEPRKFVRIHRSTIVRVDAVRETQPLFNGDRAVILQSGDKLTLSRSYRDRVKAIFGDA